MDQYFCAVTSTVFHVFPAPQHALEMVGLELTSDSIQHGSTL